MVCFGQYNSAQHILLKLTGGYSKLERYTTIFHQHNDLATLQESGHLLKWSIYLLAHISEKQLDKSVLCLQIYIALPFISSKLLTFLIHWLTSFLINIQSSYYYLFTSKNETWLQFRNKYLRMPFVKKKDTVSNTHTQKKS